jgi:putative ABC transport system permease protein
MVVDLRHSARAIARAKSTTTILLVSLALGTGANAAVYSVLDALLFAAPPGVGNASRMVNIYTSELSGAPYGQSSHPDYLSIKTGSASFSALAAVDDHVVENVRLGESGATVRIAAVSEGFFPVLGMPPHAGRLLRTSDAQTSAVISLELADQLGGAASVVGKTLMVRDAEYGIVGVATPRFRGLYAGRETDVWIPLAAAGTGRGERRLSIVAGLAPGVTRKQADDDLLRISTDLAVQYPTTNRGSIVEADSPRRLSARTYSRLDPAAGDRVFVIAAVVGGASIVLLASACLNVGNLLLSWAVVRRHEIAIKMALGATRARLVRQLLTETLCLSIAGGLLGVLFATWVAQALPALFMTEQAARLDTRLDAVAMLLTVAIAAIAGALFGVVPALRGTGSGAVTALRADAGGVSEHQPGARWRAFLVSGQVALSTVLLLATGLLVMTMAHALEGDMAAASRTVAVVSLELPGRFGDPVRGLRFRNRLLENVPKLPGVEAVGWASTLPLGRGNRVPFWVEGNSPDIGDTIEFDTNVVSPGYFRAMSLPCVEGRLFDGRDQALSPPVVIIDELLARRHLGAAAVGRQFVDPKGTRVEVVGVVRSGSYRTLQQPRQPTVYYPSSQDYLFRGYLIVRTTVDPATMLAPLAQRADEAGTGENILRTATLEQHLSDSLTLDRLTTTLVGVCGLIALAMATIGVYGTMADVVQRRTREIGLRLALGAGRLAIARLVFVEAVFLAAAGLVTGVAATVAVARIGQSFVRDVPSLDLVTLAVATGALTAALVVAAIVPLRRALRVSPNIALRAE